jgi:type II secretory ATPase GspE/PulE/Tfp pilus assembly ATPase PilB-like protein
VELSALKVTRDTTLGDLRFNEGALEGARKLVAPVAAEALARVTLKTPLSKIPFYRGNGCDQCSHTGMRGRQGLYEVMFMTPAIRKMILQNCAADELRDFAVSQGMLTLRMDGWLKIIKGVTAVDQVIRETSA